MTQLHQKLIVTVLSIVLRSPSSGKDLDAISMTLLNKQTQLSTAAVYCAECAGSKPVPSKASLSLFEAGSTPRANTISHEWRENMVRELSRGANREYESVTRMVGDICRDLELRCDEAERPYREEKIKSHNLGAKIEASRAKVAELEVNLRTQSSNLDDLKIEKSVLSKQLMTTEKRLKDQAEELEKVRHEFDQAKDASERAAQAAIETSRDQDLAYLATLTGKDEILEEQAIKLTTSESCISNLEEQVAELTAEEAKLAETIRNNETMMRELNDGIATANVLIATKQVEVDRMTESEAAVIATQKEAATRAQQASDQKDSTISTLRNQLEAANTKLEEIQHGYDVYVSTKDAEILRLGDSHNSSYERLQADLETTRDGAAIAREESMSQIASLQNMVKKLRREREEQGKKLAKAQELGSRFMAVMSNTNNQAAPPKTKSQSSACGIGNVPPEGDSCSEKRATRTNSASPLGSGTASLSGSTPKRTKTRRSPQARRTQGPMDFQPLTGAKTHRRHTMRSGRTPLAELGPMHNQAPFSPTQRISWEKFPKEIVDCEVSRKNKELQGWNSDDESFGGGDIFTSTDQQQLSALRKPLKTPEMPKHSFDESTTEF